MARTKRQDPIWVCVNTLVRGTRTFIDGSTYRESELREVRKGYPKAS